MLLKRLYGDGVVPHGLGVVYGMLSSSYAAEKLGIMSPEDRQAHDDLCWLLLKRWPLPEPKPELSLVMKLAMKDSKRGVTSEAEDEISDVLLRKMGDIVPTKTSMLSKFPCKLVEEWLAIMGFPGGVVRENNSEDAATRMGMYTKEAPEVPEPANIGKLVEAAPGEAPTI